MRRLKHLTTATTTAAAWITIHTKVDVILAKIWHRCDLKGSSNSLTWTLCLFSPHGATISKKREKSKIGCYCFSRWFIYLWRICKPTACFLLFVPCLSSLSVCLSLLPPPHPPPPHTRTRILLSFCNGIGARALFYYSLSLSSTNITILSLMFHYIVASKKRCHFNKRLSDNWSLYNCNNRSAHLLPLI